MGEIAAGLPAVTLLVTRPQPQADAWVATLRSFGVAQAMALPTLHIDAESLVPEVQAAWHRLATLDTLMFVSPAAVDAWFQAKPASLGWPQHVIAAAPGPGSAKVLARWGVLRVVAPHEGAAQYDSETLWDQLQALPWAGKQVGIVHGGAGRDWLERQWRQAGATVTRHQAYRRVTASWAAPEHQLALRAQQSPKEHVWLFSASESLKALAALAPTLAWANVRCIATHPSIELAAKALGAHQVVVCKPDPAAIAACFAANF